MKNAIPPTGAHLRSMACKLILRAALRYLADSDLSDVDSVDMPEKGRQRRTHHPVSTHDPSYPPSTASLPCSWS